MSLGGDGEEVRGEEQKGWIVRAWLDAMRVCSCSTCTLCPRPPNITHTHTPLFYTMLGKEESLGRKTGKAKSPWSPHAMEWGVREVSLCFPICEVKGTL